MRQLKIITGLIAMLIIAGCSSTSMIGSWSDPESKAILTDKVVVIGVTPRMDVRQNVENQMVDNLKKKGVNIVASLSIFPPDLRDVETIANQLNKDGYQMAIVIGLIDSKEETRYVQGTTSYAPMGYYYPFRGYMGSVYGTVYEPGYYENTTSYYIECNAYTLPEGKLVYSGQTMTVDPSSIDKFSYELATTIVKDMTDKGILPSGK